MFWTWKAKWYGKKDGKLGIPPVEQETPAPFERRVCTAAERTISRIKRKWETIDATMGGKLRTCLEAFQRAKENYDAKKDELKRSTTVRTLIPYYLTQSLIGTSEFAVNLVVFRILGENTLFTGLMAIVILISLPLAGHHIGKSLKTGWKSLTDKVLYPCEIAIVLGCLIAFAILRKDYLSAAGQNFLPPNTAVCTFIALNLLLFIASTISSYVAHDKDPEIYSFTKRYERAQARYNDINAQRQAWRAKQEGHANEIKQVGRAIITIYRDHNMRQRKKASETEMPVSFKQEPTIFVPPFEWDDSDWKGGL
ncbi:hypothetical protein HYR99_22465 [Candidatus Poribacteria bacterium]|nr:hypothetical protein [Candidatus Poribacteria bacterium]